MISDEWSRLKSRTRCPDSFSLSSSLSSIHSFPDARTCEGGGGQWTADRLRSGNAVRVSNPTRLRNEPAAQLPPRASEQRARKGKKPEGGREERRCHQRASSPPWKRSVRFFFA